jgi:DNA-directed RNA polymerase specialized sigma subunit
MNSVADKDLDLWRAWHRTRAMHDLEALMAHVAPILRTEASKYANVVSPALLDAEAKVIALKAFETYDPARAQLNTHLVESLRKLSRMAYDRQSTVHVPEHQRLAYHQYLRAKADLEDRLGYPPSVEHIADHLGLPVDRLHKVIGTAGKRELVESGEGPSFQAAHDDTESIEFAYHGMTPLQKDIFDYRTGLHGKPELANPAICKALNIPQWKLSAELTTIKAQLERAHATHA